MAKKSSIVRNEKRIKMVAHYAETRAALKKVILDPKTTDEDFYKAQRKLCKLPRNSSKVRIRNRCSITGRARAYNRHYGVSRITLRELAAYGRIPGMVKSSW
jgi:small subunit ribosomal protein S14